MAKKAKTFNGKFGSEHQKYGTNAQFWGLCRGKKTISGKKNYISEEVNHFYIIFGGKYYQ